MPTSAMIRRLVLATGAMALAFAASPLSDVAREQVGTPLHCQGAVNDRQRFRASKRQVMFHLKFHTGSAEFDAVMKMRRHGPPDAACTDGDAIDRFIDELVRERNQFLPSR